MRISLLKIKNVIYCFLGSDFPGNSGINRYSAERVFLAGKKAYRNNDSEDKCTLIKGNGGHRFYADDAWPIVHKYLKY